MTTLESLTRELAKVFINGGFADAALQSMRVQEKGIFEALAKLHEQEPPSTLDPLQEFVVRCVDELGAVNATFQIDEHGCTVTDPVNGDRVNVLCMAGLHDALLTFGQDPFKGHSSHLRLTYKENNEAHSRPI